MQNLIIGTIGHIDHGKTSLVKQITGFDGDSTQQEKQRGITIDISFSHLQSPKKNITFIDMPGHEDLVKNMIAGAFGLDGVLCVIAANEGIKPQTIEHLQICKFLGLQKFIIVLTKCDLADEETINARKDEIDLLFEELQLRYSELLQCSIYDTNSIKKLHNLLLDYEKNVKNNLDFFRYFIDRVFSIKGSGTVVTGTVLSGEVKLKQKLMVVQLQKEVEVKAIQTAHSSAEVAPIATRVALNLAKIDAKDLKRGMQLSSKGFLRGFKKLEALIELLDSDETLHNREFELYHGASKLQTKVTLLEKQGTKYYITLDFDEAVYAVFKDRFILRANGKTIGGGMILNTIADPMKKSQKRQLLELLENDDFTQAFLLLANIHKKGFGLISSIQRFGLGHERALEFIQAVDGVFVDEKALVAYPQESVEYLKKQIIAIYEKNPFALVSAKFISERFVWASVALGQYLLDNMVYAGYLRLENGLYLQKDADMLQVTNFMEQKIYSILQEAKLTPQAPYNIYESLDLDRKSGDAIFKKLCVNQKIKRLAHNYFITIENLEEAKQMMKDIIKKHGYIDIYTFKQELALSRKYLVSLLDFLDTMPYIQNKENKRYLIG